MEPNHLGINRAVMTQAGGKRMGIKFNLIIENIEPEPEPDIDLVLFQKSLSSDFIVEKDDEGIYITIQLNEGEGEKCQNLVNRELDRYFFLTAVKIRAEMVRTIYKLRLTIEQTVYSGLPEGIKPQNWNDTDRHQLPMQLRLWSLAIGADDLCLRAILFYQIIELSGCDFPRYSDEKVAPLPLAEARFLRNWVAHAGEDLRDSMARYCRYLKIEEKMFERTSSAHMDILKRKLKLLEAEAKAVISKSL